MTTLKVENIHFQYGMRPILQDISFSAQEGEDVYILGPNGVGKSTLFRCIMGHLKPTKGEVMLMDRPASHYSPRELAQKVAYISQNCHPTFNYSVLQLVLMGRTPYLSPFASPSAEDEYLANEMLEKMGIAGLKDAGIYEISGGERQLAMIARALLQQAKILIMDEPTASLDYGNQIRIQQQMKALTKEGLLVIQSSHQPEHALYFADKIVALNKGHVIAYGTAKETITEALLWALYGLKVELKESRLYPKLEDNKAD